jgi:Domain of Unknown Function with PDB structure (DUF3861)
MFADMKQHRYRITLEHLATAKGEPGTHPPLAFEARNHDDLFQIVERARGKQLLDADSATAMVLGLKLLSEVALENRDNPLFAELRGPLREFIMKLKKTGRADE